MIRQEITLDVQNEESQESVFGRYQLGETVVNIVINGVDGNEHSAAIQAKDCYALAHWLLKAGADAQASETQFLKNRVVGLVNQAAKSEQD